MCVSVIIFKTKRKIITFICKHSSNQTMYKLTTPHISVKFCVYKYSWNLD